MPAPRTILLAFLMVLALSARAAETPLYFGLETADIPVIRTGKELLKTPPIADNDRTLHIAIERTECKLNEGALIYVAVENPAAPATAAATGAGKTSIRREPLRNRLGPVVLDIQRLDSKDAVDPVNAGRDTYRDPNFAKDQTPLYIGVIQPSRPGKYAIRILSTDGNLLAKTTFTVAEESVQPWLYVDATDFDLDAKEPIKVTAYGEFCRAAFSRVPVLLPNDDLPQLLPGKESANFKISAHDSLISVEINAPLSTAECPFMARLLINGKQPPAPEEYISRFRNPSRTTREAKSAKFDISLDLALFNPQPGDRITLQLACSPFGVEQTNNQMIRSSRRLSVNKPLDPILVSNTITYTIPKSADTAPATAP